MTISSAGIGSGLDVNAIVSQLVAIERRPITLLKGEVGQLQTQLSAFGRLQGALSTLRDAALALTKPATWTAMAATSSNPTNLSATATGTAQPGRHEVVVTSLAQGQTVATRAFAGPSAVLGSGTLRIELGDFDADPPVPKAGATAIDVTIAPGADTLSAVRDAINAAGAGVRASISSDASGSRLVLRSAETGLENGFRVEVLTDDDGNAGDANGLSALAWDPHIATDPQTAATRPQAAANAQFTVDGLPLTSTTNTLAGAIQGVSLTLRQAGTTEVVVEPDNAALTKALDSFVSAYNATVNMLREQTRYDPTTKQAGALQGDRGAIQLLGQLRRMFTDSSGASSVFTRLADAGLKLNTDGTIVVDTAKRDAALANRGELQKLFANADAGVPANNGFAKRFQQWLDGVLGSDGAIDARQQGLKDRLRAKEQQQERLEDRVKRTEERLLRQYSALDNQMGQLNALSSYVLQQMAMLNASSIAKR
jgi:flagellar hook-associated protein 2